MQNVFRISPDFKIALLIFFLGFLQQPVLVYATNPEPCSFEKLVNHPSWKVLLNRTDLNLLPPGIETASKEYFFQNQVPIQIHSINTEKVVIDGLEATLLRTGGIVPGTMNKGIYFVHRDYEPRVVKLLPLPQNLGRDRNIDILNINERKVFISAVQSVVGNLIAAKQGGPQLKRFGIAEMGGLVGSKTSFLYLELEKIFPETSGQDNTNKTLKQYQSHYRFGLGNRFLIKGPDGLTAPQRMAKFYAEALEQGVLPIDPDFITNEKGEIRWLDGDFWRYVDTSIEASDEGFADALTHHQRALITLTSNLRTLDPKYETDFREQLNQELQTSNSPFASKLRHFGF